MGWRAILTELEQMLPEGYSFREEPDFLLLIGPDGKTEMVWSAYGPTKESIAEDVKKFFAPKERC